MKPVAIALALVAATHGFVPYVRHARSPVRISPSDARSAARGAAPAAVAAEPSHDVAAPGDAVSPAQLCFRLRNGALMPAVGLGTWKGAPGTAEATSRRRSPRPTVTSTARSSTATSTRSARVRARSRPTGLGLRREDVFVTSKIMMGDSPRLAGAGAQGHHPRDFEAQCRATLADLRLEYIDLYVIHWPIEGELGDGDTLEAAWAAMERIVDLGLAKAIGVSNNTPKKLDRVLAVARVAPAVNQVEAHPRGATTRSSSTPRAHRRPRHGVLAPRLARSVHARRRRRARPHAMRRDSSVRRARHRGPRASRRPPAETRSRPRRHCCAGACSAARACCPSPPSRGGCARISRALAACPWALDAPAMAVLDGWQEQYRLGPGAIHTGPNRNHKTLAALWDEDVAWARGLAFDTRDGFKLE